MKANPYLHDQHDAPSQDCLACRWERDPDGGRDDWIRQNAFAAAISIIDQHIPSMTWQDEQAILGLGAPHPLDQDPANFAIRTCQCGKKIDGFYEYVDHLKEELRKAGMP